MKIILLQRGDYSSGFILPKRQEKFLLLFLLAINVNFLSIPTSKSAPLRPKSLTKAESISFSPDPYHM